MRAIPKSGSGAGRFWMIIAFVLTYLAGIYSEKLGFLQFAMDNPEEIRILFIEHVQLVLISSAISISRVPIPCRRNAGSTSNMLIHAIRDP